MASLQNVVGRAYTRLRDVNTSQRIALLLGGALVAISLIWLAHWAGTPEMVPLLDQDLATADVALVQAGLQAMNEAHEVRGNRVYVRGSANRAALVAQLQQQEKLPANTSAGFAALIKESDPWTPGEERDRRWTYALQKELELVLRQFQGVQSAGVFLNLGAVKRSFTRTPPASSASITLVMRQGAEVPRALALAAARLVSGAVAGLPVHNVQVVDASGRTALDWEGEQDVGAQLEQRVAKEELRYAEKIRLQVPDPKALVSVQVELNSTASNVETEQPLKGIAETEKVTRSESTRGRNSEEPGVTPNVGMKAGGAAVAETQTEETSETQTRVGTTKKTEATPAGEIRKVSAAISLSHSYLADVFRRSSASAGDPTDAQIEEVFQKEKARLVAQVLQLVKPQSEENVAISRYFDVAIAAATSAVDAAPTAVSTSMELVKSYGPAAGLGALALTALALMLRMSRKSDVAEAFGLELGLPEEAVEAARAAAADVSAIASSLPPRVRRAGRAPGTPETVVTSGGTPVLTPVEGEFASPIENASVTEGMLVAQEVDAGTVQTRKMLEQIGQVVDSDSEAVSTLVDQWLHRQAQFRDEMS
jgi:flagellar biosynthesis/type III secretory pathway M-ring protein FliF/YscJ